MTYGLWQSVGGMQVNEYRQAVTANNLANADTVGFKHDLAVISERRMESRTRPNGLNFRHPVLEGMGGGNWVQRTYHSFAQGDLRSTGGPLDVAINGQGFFAVTDGKDVRYTRDGKFTQNSAGDLIMIAGQGRYRVLDEAGAPIQLIPDGEPPQVRPDGAILQGGTEVGRLGVVAFEDPQQLKKAGANMFTAPKGTTVLQMTEPDLHAGFIEDSTVNPTDMLASMIEVTRAYELNATMISMQDQTLGRAVNNVGRLVA